MRCIILLTVLVLAVYVNAGKVVINGVCVDCNTPKPHPADSTTRKPTTKQAEDSSEEVGRYKRQWGTRQVILTDDGGAGGAGGGGGWSGGRVTTIDGRGLPGTVVRNDDCVNCNIRG